MFDPSWDDGCPSCTAGRRRDARRPARAPAHPRHHARLRLPRAAGQDRGLQGAQGWTFPWYSSYGSDFNYDFQVTLDESVAPVDVQLPHASRARAAGTGLLRGRRSPRAAGSAASCATATRLPHLLDATPGAPSVGGSYYFLDLTALGRQEDWEEPKGRADRRPRRHPDFTD